MEEEYMCKTGYTGRLYYASLFYAYKDKRDTGFVYPVIKSVGDDKKIRVHQYVFECLGRQVFKFIYVNNLKGRMYGDIQAMNVFTTTCDNFMMCRIFCGLDPKTKNAKYKPLAVDQNLVEEYKNQMTIYYNRSDIKELIETIKCTEDNDNDTNIETNCIDEVVSVDFGTIVDIYCTIECYGDDAGHKKKMKIEFSEGFVNENKLNAFIGCSCRQTSCILHHYLTLLDDSAIKGKNHYYLNGLCLYETIDKDSDCNSVFKTFKYSKKTFTIPTKILSTKYDELGIKRVFLADDVVLDVFQKEKYIFGTTFLPCLIKSHSGGEVELLYLTKKNEVMLKFKNDSFYVPYSVNYLLRIVLDEFCSFLDILTLQYEEDQQYIYHTSIHQKFLNPEILEHISIMSDDIVNTFCFMLVLMQQGHIDVSIFEGLMDCCSNTNFYTGRYDEEKVWDFVSDSILHGKYLLQNFNYFLMIFGMRYGRLTFFDKELIERTKCMKSRVLVSDEMESAFEYFFGSYPLLRTTAVEKYIQHCFKNRLDKEQLSITLSEILDENFDMSQFGMLDITCYFQELTGLNVKPY